MAISKVIYGNRVLIDITDSTSEASNLLSGTIGYGANGSRIVGSCDPSVIVSGSGSAELISGNDYNVILS